jgi:hypothetical protein
MTLSGCRDKEAAQVAREAADRQAQQNQLVGKLVEEHLKRHSELLQVYQRLQSAWDKLHRQWNVLDSERRKLAADRRTESMLVAMTRGVGLLLLAMIALGRLAQ